MKKLVIMAGIVALAMVNTSSKNAEVQDVFNAPINWTKINFKTYSFEEAKAEAKASGKLIFVDAYAQWCGPCLRMQATTFKDPDVGEFFNANFVNWKVDTERHKDGPAIMQKYGVNAYPTLLFIDANGTLIKKSIGQKTRDQLLALANSI